MSNRYRIDFDKTVEMVMPTYLVGKVIRLFTKVLLYPLHGIESKFAQWSSEMSIANQVTSQKILLEKYLTNKLSSYFSNSDSYFEISHKNPYTSRLYVYGKDQTPPPSYENVYAYRKGEKSDSEYAYIYESGFLGSSFYVIAPIPNTSLISKDEYESKIVAIVDMYKLSSKNYKIIYKQ